MKSVLRHITLILSAFIIIAGAILSVSASSEELDDYPVTHKNSHCQTGELQHVASIHFDNLVYLQPKKQISFRPISNQNHHIQHQVSAEPCYFTTIWQPPKFI